MITQKTKIVAGSSFVFFCISVLGTILLLQYIQNLGTQLAVQAQEAADFENKTQTYRELERVVESTKTERTLLESFVLTESRTIDFLSMIENNAQKQGIELTTNSLKVTKGEGLFDSLRISYDITGTKQRVDTFLLLLETLPFHANISKLSLKYSNDKGYVATKGTLELTVSLLKYDQ